MVILGSDPDTYRLAQSCVTVPTKGLANRLSLDVSYNIEYLTQWAETAVYMRALTSQLVYTL